MPAGLDTMGALSFAQDNALRPPDPALVATALKAFFAQRKGPFEDFHMDQSLKALNYLVDNPKDHGEPWLTKQELEVSLFTEMLLPHRQPTVIKDNHLLFGRALLHELERLAERESEAQQGGTPILSETSDSSETSKTPKLPLKCIRLLSAFGATAEARDLAVKTFPFDPTTTKRRRQGALAAWERVLDGFVREQNLTEMIKTGDMLQSLAIPVTQNMHASLVHLFAGMKDLERAMFWYSQTPVNSCGDTSVSPLGSTSSDMLKACALTGNVSFGQQIVAAILQHDMPDKASWDAIFVWSAAMGKGADEVERMMNVLVRRNDEAREKNPDIPVIRPDVDTINALVEFSISRQDPYTAERYITLGEKRNILPNEKTFAMQIQYRISVGDLDGARAAYFNLQGDFSGSEYSVAVINQLIQALCTSKQHHFDELMAMVDDLLERKAGFAPETVAALTLLHLRRAEIHDAMDLLQVHAHQYSPVQRKLIQKALLAFILDGETSTSDAWDGYQILRNVFIEASREDRVIVMKQFFARNRSDMACHVFFHMRNHISDARSADRDVYIAAFTGFARCADAESLELANNQLKLDLRVDLDTKLRNALMMAYAATGENQKALQYWREICESREGPTYNSIAIAFRSCEGINWGGEHAKSIWRRLQEQDVEIDKSIWTAYMCAIARNHNHKEALALIESVEEEYGFTPDVHM